jgi:hypothetical protein
MQKMRALGELPAQEAPSPTITRMVTKGWVKRVGSSEAFRLTAAGETALKRKLPLNKGSRPAIPNE